jgi:hypothetical protein
VGGYPTPWQPYVEPSDDLVAPRRVDPTGVAGPTKRQAAGRRWRQSVPGMYVPAEVDSERAEQRILEQSHRIRRWGAVTGWAALRWRGAAYFDGRGPLGDLLPVPLVVGRQHVAADPRVSIDQSQLAPGERLWIRGVPVTTVQRALFDVLRRERSLRSGVVAMDMAAAARLISVDLMRAYVLHRFAWTGVPRSRRVLALASNESASPQETLMRLVWVLDAGLDEPLCNRPVFSLDGRLLGYPDLFDPSTGTAGEYDGAHHREPTQRRRDIDREARFRDHGIETFSLVEGDLRDRRATAARMRSARERALRSGAVRRWTLEAPAGWVSLREPLDRHLTRTAQDVDLWDWGLWSQQERFRELPCSDIHPGSDPFEG